MIESTQQIAYFVQISDTHIGPTADFARHGHKSLPCAQEVVSIVNNLPTKPDFVIHTGDIVTNPDPDSYKLAAETFAQLEMPIYYVTGNHDSTQDICHYLPMGEKETIVASPNVLAYKFDVKGYRFLVLDARGPDEIDPHGLLSQEQLAFVQREAAVGSLPLVVFMHYPCHPMNSTWMDAYMLVINGPELHKALLPARDRLRGVFYGHVHQNMQIMRDGILYVSAASTFSQFSAWPGHASPGYDSEHAPGYNFVHLLPEQTIIHQHTFSRPE